jgi:hypothetical protein
MKDICKKCVCRNCIFTMPQGDSTDCYQCEMCIDGDLRKEDCRRWKGWGGSHEDTANTTDPAHT